MIPTSFVRTVTSEVAPGGTLCQRITYQHPEGWYGSYVVEVPTSIKIMRDNDEQLEMIWRKEAQHLFVGQPEQDNSAIARYLDGRMGPLLTVQDGLGLFFGDTEEDAVNCRSGWVFINRQTATKEQVQEAIDLLKQGRETWPKKD